MKGVFIREDLSLEERKLRMQQRREKYNSRDRASGHVHVHHESNVTMRSALHDSGPGDLPRSESSN